VDLLRFDIGNDELIMNRIKYFKKFCRLLGNQQASADFQKAVWKPPMRVVRAARQSVP
jgi:hypothetical protein